MELNQVVALVKARDERGLEYLYENYSAALNGIIFRVIGSKKDAEEILQQTFLKIWDKIDQYEEKKSTLFTWMVSIARNSALDKKRLKSFQNNHKTDSWDIQHDASKMTNPQSGHIDTKNLLAKIDPKYKAVLDYVYLQGYTQADAAIKLDIPLGTVKSRIRLGINILRQELSTEKALFMGSVTIIIFIIFSLCQ